MKLKVKITESQLEELRSKYSTLKSIDDNKNPYIKKGFLFIKLDSTKSIPKDSYNFSDDEAKELNKMGHELEALKVAYEEKLKSLTGGNKPKKENR